MKGLKWLWVAAAAMMGSGVLYTPQEAVAQVNQLDADINIIPDKVTKTDEGVRISLCLVGIPHTSQRIDSVDLRIGKQVYPANDIDGVDFKRYFQFEDEGVQTIEVNFPFKGVVPKTATLDFHTVKGIITSPARQ